MRRSFLPIVSLAVLLGTVPAFAAGHKKHSTGGQSHTHSSSHATVRRTSAHARGRSSSSSHAAAPTTGFRSVSRAGITDERATAIQSALIQRGYLSGEPTGHWDSASTAAMQKLQSDNGWQTKVVPDSRALIKLGLGSGSTIPATSPTTSPVQPQPVAPSPQTN